MKISKDGEGRKSEMRESALHYYRLGFNVVPTTKCKKPIGSWKAAQQRRQEATAVAGMTWNAGVAAVCGPVSGDLLALDIDAAEDDAVCLAVLSAMGLPADYPWVVQTPGQGFHIWVRCPAAELEQQLGDKGKLIGDLPGCKQVELRWTGCIAVLPPSLHPNGNRYAFWNGDGIPDEPPTMRGPRQYWPPPHGGGARVPMQLRSRTQMSILRPRTQMQSHDLRTICKPHSPGRQRRLQRPTKARVMIL